MSALTVAELEEMLRGKNLATSGTKGELLTRLLEAGVPESSLQLSSVTRTDAGEDASDSGTQEMTSTSTESTRSRTPNELELLQREREVAEREIQQLRRELEQLRVAGASGASPSTQPRKMKWTDVREMIGDFDCSNSDIEAWEKQLRKLVQTHGLDDQTAKVMVCYKLKDKALKWYHSRSDCVDLSYDQLLNGLRSMFGERSYVLSLRHDFERRVWKTDESFGDYMHDKVVLGNRVPISDKEVVDYIIEGIPDANIRSTAQVRCFKSPEELLQTYAKLSLFGETRRPKQTQRRETSTPTAKSTKEQREPRDAKQI